MKTNLISINKGEKNILERLLQLYLHDISYYFPIEFNSLKGKYVHDSLEKYFDNSNNYAYFIKQNNDIIGFVLVDKDESMYVLQEMFIINNYKNKGLGEEAVHSLFDQKRGKWIIRSLPSSPLAEKFWNRTINNYTNGNYNIEHIGNYNRAVFTFKNIE